MDKEKNSPKEWEKIAAYAFGVVFIITLIVLSVSFPRPTKFQYEVFRIVLALACAGVGSVLPGFLKLTIPNFLRAGGATAIFVLVYFYSPAQLVTETVVETDPKSLSFGLNESERALTFMAKGPEAVAWQFDANDQFSVEPSAGSIEPNTSYVLIVKIHREKLNSGMFDGKLGFIYSLKPAGLEEEGTRLKVAVTAVKPHPIEYKILSVDDQLFIFVNEQEIERTSLSTGWKTIPVKHLLIGSNLIEIRVHNVASRRGNQFGKREGWHYGILVRSGDTEHKIEGSSNGEPPTEQWGTTFSVKKFEALLDRRQGIITFKGI